MKARAILALVCIMLGALSLAAADLAVSAGANICLLRQKELRDAYGAVFRSASRFGAAGKTGASR
jgi:hypothetical protein